MSVRTDIPAASIFVAVEPQAGGHTVFIRRRGKSWRGLTVGPAQPREIERIKEQHPELAKQLGL